MNNKIRISDIQTTDILFFEQEIKERCLEFCRERDIDCLPSLDDGNKIYVRDEINHSFHMEVISDERKVDANLDIFDKDLLQTFSGKTLLMVYSNKEFTGVVHFSDYNKSVVSLYLYELFLSYEKNLRTLLRKQGLKNEDMIAYFEAKKASAKKEKDVRFYEDKILQAQDNLKKNSKLRQFEVFYLADLIALSNHHKVVSLGMKVFELRNWVMHAHEFVGMENPEADDLIYNLGTFKKFFELVLILQNDHKKVANRLMFVS